MRWPWWFRRELQDHRSLLPDGRIGIRLVLQHAAPGKKGNLGNNTVVGMGTWRFDANLGKTFRIPNPRASQVRFDAQNVLNHPQPANPNLRSRATRRLVRLTTKSNARLLQGQLRLSF